MTPRFSPFLFASIVLVGLFGATPANADVLPVVSDATGPSTACWWCDDASSTVQSALYEGIAGRAASGALWAWPDAGVDDVSRVLRTPDLTPANGRSLATVFGSRHALVGTLHRDAAPGVPWLGLERAAWLLDATLVDVRTGAEVDVVQLRAVAFGDDAAEASAAAATLLLDRLEERIAPLSVDGSDDGVDVGEPVVVVMGSGAATAYIAFRGALREAHPGVVDVEEVWATEGQVALRVVLDEGTVFDDVADAVDRLQGQALEGVRIVDAQRRDDRVYVSVALPSVE